MPVTVMVNLADPDGGETGTTWQWASLPDGTDPWTDRRRHFVHVHTGGGGPEDIFAPPRPTMTILSLARLRKR